MFYKVIKDNKVIDVLDNLSYVRYQKKHNIMLWCEACEAQAILSSDRRYAWHIDGLYHIPVDGYDTVELVEIDQYEYDRLKLLNCKTAEEIIDLYTLELMKDGVL